MVNFSSIKGFQSYHILCCLYKVASRSKQPLPLSLTIWIDPFPISHGPPGALTTHTSKKPPPNFPRTSRLTYSKTSQVRYFAYHASPSIHSRLPHRAIPRLFFFFFKRKIVCRDSFDFPGWALTTTEAFTRRLGKSG